MIKYTKAVTLMELIVVVIIIGILATFAIAVPRGQLERAKATGAQTQLKLIWAAEKDYYIYNGSYTNQWSDLNIDDPNIGSESFAYAVETTNPLLIKATRKGKTSGFQIDTDGRISDF